MSDFQREQLCHFLNLPSFYYYGFTLKGKKAPLERYRTPREANRKLSRLFPFVKLFEKHVGIPTNFTDSNFNIRLYSENMPINSLDVECSCLTLSEAPPAH